MEKLKKKKLIKIVGSYKKVDFIFYYYFILIIYLIIGICI